MHTKLLHIYPCFQVRISIPSADKSINQTLQGELINRVINCSNSCGFFKFLTQMFQYGHFHRQN